MPTLHEIVSAAHRRELVIEGAGIFWLGCEGYILILVAAGRRYLDATPLPAAFTLTQREWRRCAALLAGLAALALAVYGRHAVSRPAAALLDAQGILSGIAPEAWRELLRAQNHVHLTVWAAFIVGWIALETAIVYHGWRGYRRLRQLLDAAAEQ